MNIRFLFVCCTLLALAQGSYADGNYQRTKDRKILVWNSDPQRGDTASWSGDRDEEGYATGSGVLTWYSAQQKIVTGSRIPAAKLTMFGRYSGNMVRGKFDGVVDVNAKGKIAHATFAEGKRTSDWTPGPADGERRNERVAKRTADGEPEPPAAGPSASPPSFQPQKEQAQRDPVVETPAERPSPVAAQAVSGLAVTHTPSESSDSLRSLASPPSGLRSTSLADAPPQSSAPIIASSPTEEPTPLTVTSPPAGPRLHATEVVTLANAEARKQGYDLREYQRGEAHHAAEDDTWTVLYEQESVDRNGMSKNAKPFKVSVEDKTKKASVIPDR